LEVWVGTTEGAPRLRALIENRLTLPLREQGLRLAGEVGEGVGVICAGGESFLALCDLLADIVLEEMQVRFLVRRLERDYGFIDERESGRVLIGAPRRLWQGSEREARQRREVARRIALFLGESPARRLMLDGFLRFRLQDCTLAWERALADSVEEYLRRHEQQELIGLLRFAISMREPLIDYVRLCPAEEGYLLLGRDGTRVRVLLPGSPQEDGELLAEDALFIQLVHLSPEAIDVSQLPPGELRSLLRRVFVGRLRE